MENQIDRKASSHQDIAGLLKDKGILPTRQRLKVARLLFMRDQHLSAEQVIKRINADGDEHVSKATVYNTLGLFARKGLVREVIIDPARVFYDTNTSEHHHFYNVDTGELKDIDASVMCVDALPELPAGTITEGVDVIIRVRNAAQARQ